LEITEFIWLNNDCCASVHAYLMILLHYNIDLKFFKLIEKSSFMYLFIDYGSVSSVSSAASVLSLASLTPGIKSNMKVSARKKKPDGVKYSTLLHKRLRKCESY
jgi:hypothetical protein